MRIQNQNQLPPPVSADDVYLPPNHSDNQTRAPDQQDQSRRPKQADLMTAVQLLVEIAGPASVHIEMSARGPKKYYDVHRHLEAQDARAHLQGWKTKGGWIRRPDGMTRALAYDADTEEEWEELKTAARFLTYGEYVALLEPSPVGRGGHLWVIFSDLVKARDAESVSVASAATMPNCDDQAHARKEGAPKQAEPRVDQYWQQQYGRYLWFQFTPAQLAAWYNARHSVQNILPPGKNRMGLASWRGERTASVGYTKWCIRQVQATFGSCAIPGFLRG